LFWEGRAVSLLPRHKTIRRDLFEVGDRVEFIDEDEYTGFGMAERHRSAHGRGPYVVEEVEDWTHGAPWMLDRGIVSHAQLVWVDGERYSGGWFKPVRAPFEPCPVDPDWMPAEPA
jgi:hypothetical protein